MFPYLYEVVDSKHEYEITPGDDQGAKYKQPRDFIEGGTPAPKLHEEGNILRDEEQHLHEEIKN